MADPVVRIAARGDGVTAAGRHVPFSVPGDQVFEDGRVGAGPHHQVPPCRHFPECGGCQLQHADDAAYAGYVAERVRSALASHGLECTIHAVHLSPPRSRRRTTLRAIAAGGRVLIGFNEEKSHRVIDLDECHVIRPELFTLLDPLRTLLAGLLSARGGAEVAMTLCDQGLDLLLKGVAPITLDHRLALSDFAQAHALARLATESGLGPEIAWEPEPATVTLSGVRVVLPVGAFLQATADGEAVLRSAVCEAIAGARASADLFAGLGTFTFASRACYAAEAGRDALAALKRAAPSIRAEHRDLYRRPLDPAELGEFDSVIIDPPRAGAAQQVAQLARSEVASIAYVSCNPATFARDARTLCNGGYALSWVKPVGQFRWSTHVELCAAFSR